MCLFFFFFFFFQMCVLLTGAYKNGVSGFLPKYVYFKLHNIPKEVS